MSDKTPSLVFANAPVVETRLVVQFRPLDGFRLGHFGLFWQECLGKDEWRILPDAELQPHEAERFDSVLMNPPLDLKPVDATPARMALRSADGKRLVQFQPDQLSIGFTRAGPGCPQYEQVRGEFARLFDELVNFAKRHELPAIEPDLWEITYVNLIREGDLWKTSADWHSIFPTLFGPTAPDAGGCRWSSFNGTWYFVIPPDRGRVQVRVTKSVVNQTKELVLLLVSTARGPVGGETPTWADGIDLGHSTAVRVFYDLASPHAREYWGVQQ